MRMKKGNSLPQLQRAFSPVKDIESLPPDCAGDRIGDERQIGVHHPRAGEFDGPKPTNTVGPNASFTPFNLLLVNDLVGQGGDARRSIASHHQDEGF